MKHKMGLFLVCYWQVCSVGPSLDTMPKMICGQHVSGTPGEMANASVKLTGNPGDIFNSECVKDGVKPHIEWTNRKGIQWK